MIALYPGAFKPPHRGHFEVVKSLLDGNHNGRVYTKDDYKDAGTSALSGKSSKVEKINKVIVFPGSQERNGITKSESMAIWNIYAKYLPGLEVLDGEKNPMFAAKEYAKANPDEKFYAITGIRGEEDLIDLRRITTFTNTPHVQGLVIPAAKGNNVRATQLRSAALSGNLDDLRDFFPKQLSREELLKILKMLKDNIIAEMMNQKMETLFEEMFASEEPVKEYTPPVDTKNVDRQKLTYLYDYIGRLLPSDASANFKDTHFIVTRESESINESKKELPEYTNRIASVLEYMLDQKMKIVPLPEINTIQDEENAKNFFGKTAYYDPNKKEVVLYTTGRHPKDIVRSFVHEMIHHMQNLEGRLGNINTQNTNEDDHLMEIEKEAYLLGNITFRNWEDSIKNKNVMAEGKYDKISNDLSSAVFKVFKDAYDKGKEVKDTFRIGPEPDADYEHNLEFDLNIYMKLSKDRYSVDGGANAGYDKDGDEIQPLINVVFELPKDVNWRDVSFDIKDVIRHEIEHLTQDGENLKQGKYIPDDQDLRDLIDNGLLDKDNYYKLPKEVDAMIQGMYFKAKKSKTPFEDVVNQYFDRAKVTAKERPIIKSLWNKRLPALGIKQRLKENYSDLEQYRKLILKQLKDSKIGKQIRNAVEDKVGKEAVEGVYIIGSVLDSKKFHEESDIDLAVLINVPNMDKGTNEEMSYELSQTYSIPDGGFVDVSIWNKSKPSGKMVKLNVK